MEGVLHNKNQGSEAAGKRRKQLKRVYWATGSTWGSTTESTFSVTLLAGTVGACDGGGSGGGLTGGGGTCGAVYVNFSVFPERSVASDARRRRILSTGGRGKCSARLSRFSIRW
uniref:Uncharacterized protein n=1 Tax=Branchiostoma floridae TaxID=7739 RepID=C3YG09_BRAFL|eukprot:XP_002604804.1 hypothetical protein BRAFLDRAFT_70654 [Branchiostoma floridae]